MSKVREFDFVVGCSCWCWGWWSWLNASNIYIFQFFCKIFFWQCWETYKCEYQSKNPDVVLSKVREFAFVVGWWCWCWGWWSWLNASNIYIFQFFSKKLVYNVERGQTHPLGPFPEQLGVIGTHRRPLTCYGDGGSTLWLALMPPTGLVCWPDDRGGRPEGPAGTVGGPGRPHEQMSPWLH